MNLSNSNKTFFGGIIIVILVGWIFQTSVWAQKDEKLVRADALHTEAIKLFQQGTDDSIQKAYLKFKEAAGVYLTLVDTPETQSALLNFGGNLTKIADAFRDNKNYSSANLYYEEVLPIYRKIKDVQREIFTLHNLGYVAGKLDKNEAAVDFYIQALDGYRRLKDRNGEATILVNLAITYNYLKSSEKSLEFYQKALEIYQADENKAKQAELNESIGNILYDRGDYATAVKYYERVLIFYRADGNKQKESEILSDLGNSFINLLDSAKAKDYYEQAIGLNRELNKTDQEAEFLQIVADNFNFIKDYETAESYLRRVLTIAETKKDRRLKTKILGKLGENFINRNRFDDAENFLRQANELLKSGENDDLAINIYNHYGVLYSSRGENKTAAEYYQKALESAVKTKNEEAQAFVLASIAGELWYVNRFDEAVEYANKSLEIFRRLKNKYGESLALNKLSTIYESHNKFEEAVKVTEESLKIARENNYKPVELDILVNYGVLMDSLGQRERGIEYYQQGLVLARQLKDLNAEGIIYTDIGYNYFLQEKYPEAEENLKKAIDILHRVKDLRGEAYTVHNLGLVYYKLKNYDQALKLYGDALKIYIQVNDRRPQAFVYDSYGEVYTALGQFDKAAESLEKSVMLAREIDYAEVEANALGNLMRLWQKREVPRLAIFYGKQTVNIYQKIRSENRNLDKKTLKDFIGSKEKVYRQLADLLVGEGRLAEAEQVLAMLKQEELADFVRRDADDVEKLTQRAELTVTENDALKKYDEIAGNIAKNGTEYNALRERREKGEELNPEEKTRYAELSRRLRDANQAFQDYLKVLQEQFSQNADKSREINENLGLQADLKEWGKDVVFVYTLVGADRYRVIVTSASGKIPRQTEIKAADLNTKIQQFRQVVQNPNLDPRPAGQELYNILIKPIEQDLRDLKAKTILWSLDGSLRLLPLAALWDGKQYFGQQYENVIVTLASRTRLGDTVSQNWRVLGLGVSEGQTVREPNGTRDIVFSPLPAVKNELATIIRDAKSPDQQGILPGAKLIDKEFTETALGEQLLDGFKVVHIASHFNLNPGDAAKSFLLIGGGKALTVNEIKVNREIDFSGVELLTLSACQTAVEQNDDAGKEVESFGVIAQQKGAKAILATLWSVADESTQILMSEFYRLKKENPSMTKSQMMQLAQNAMINGKIQPATEDGKKRAELVGTPNPKINAPPFPFDKSKPFAHPYYWSPFVLIGNWK